MFDTFILIFKITVANKENRIINMLIFTLFPLQRILVKLQHTVLQPSLAEKHANDQTSIMANKLQHQTKRRKLYITVKNILCFQKHVFRLSN